jgi:hypothetical protein
MAQLFNEQRILGVRLQADGATMFNGLPVIGVVDAGNALFTNNRRALGVKVLDADAAIYNDQVVRGVVQILDGRKLYNNQLVIPVSGLFTDFGLFGANDNGFLFNFSKTDRLFQDTAGTTAVAADADPIALALEGHAFGGKTLAQVIAGQPELNPNPGPFANATGYTASSGTLAIVGDEIEQTTSAAAASVVSLPVTTVVGQFYVLQYDAHRGSSSTISIQAGTAAAGGAIASATISSATSVTGQIIFKATTTTTYLQMVNNQAVAGRTGYVRQLSCKAIPGNHGLQATTSARPFWKTPNFARFDGTDDRFATSFPPGAAMTLGFYGITSLADANGTRAIGPSGGTNQRCAIGLSATITGSTLVGSWGAVAEAVKGPGSIIGTKICGFFCGDANGLQLWQDGVQVATAAPFGSPTGNANGISIGAQGIGNLWNGDIYNALAINRVLTPAEIVNLTNYWKAQ